MTGASPPMISIPLLARARALAALARAFPNEDWGAAAFGKREFVLKGRDVYSRALAALAMEFMEATEKADGQN